MTALPNTPFFDLEYIKEYEIDIVETTPAFYHHELKNPTKILPNNLSDLHYYPPPPNQDEH